MYFLHVSDNSQVTHGHSLKLVKEFSRTRTDIQHFSFSQRVVNEWNSLPEWVVSSNSVLSFKVNIDKFFTNSPLMFVFLVVVVFVFSGGFGIWWWY